MADGLYTTDETLSLYIDIVNRNGRQSCEACEFYDKYKGDSELKRLMDATRELKTLFERGELK